LLIELWVSNLFLKNSRSGTWEVFFGKEFWNSIFDGKYDSLYACIFYLAVDQNVKCEGFVLDMVA